MTVKKIIADALGVKIEDLTIRSDLVEDLGADSLDLVEITMKLEDEYNINIGDDEMENKKTISDIIELLDDKNVDSKFLI